RAVVAEGAAVARLLHPLQYLPADAGFRLVGFDLGDVEEPRGVHVAIFPLELIAALRNRANATPPAIGDLEDVVDHFEGGGVAFGPHGPRILDLDFGATGFELLDHAQNAFEQIDRLEARDDDRDSIAFRERSVFANSHDRADVAGAEKALHAVARSLQD